MNKEKSTKKVVVLSIVWLISFVVAALFSIVWNMIVCFQTGSFSVSILDPYPLVVLFSVLLWFLPGLIVIYCNAKHAELKAIRVISLILILFFSAWLCMSSVFTVLALCGIT